MKKLFAAMMMAAFTACEDRRSNDFLSWTSLNFNWEFFYSQNLYEEVFMKKLFAAMMMAAAMSASFFIPKIYMRRFL